MTDTDYMVLGGSICIRCGFEPLHSAQGEWWCPECWSSGNIVTPHPVEPPDSLLAACRDIVNVQRSQLKAKRAGEQLGEASILGGPCDNEIPVEPTPDDTAPWEQIDPDYVTKMFAEWDEELGRGIKGSWVSRRHPELSWLDHLKDKSFFRLPESVASLHTFYPQISEVEWRVLLV